MSMVGFPLLLIPVAIYNIIAFLMPGVPLTEQAEPLFKVMLVSGVEWPVTLRDMLLALGILMLMFEVIKGARPGAKYLMDHLLSLIVFGAAAAEFVLWPRFGTSTYFLLTLLALVDFLSGIALRTRRSALAASAPAVSRKSARKSETPVAEPQFEPAPAPIPAPTPAPTACTGSRSCTRSHDSGAARSLSRRICIAGSPRTGRRKFGVGFECRVRRQHQLAGSAVSRSAAGHQRAAVAGRAALICDFNQTICRSRRPVPTIGMPVRGIGGVGVGSRGAPQAARLRDLLDGRNQMGDENRAGAGQRTAARPLRGRDHRYQCRAGGASVLGDAVVRHLSHLIVIQHRKLDSEYLSRSGTFVPSSSFLRKGCAKMRRRRGRGRQRTCRCQPISFHAIDCNGFRIINGSAAQ